VSLKIKVLLTSNPHAIISFIFSIAAFENQSKSYSFFSPFFGFSFGF